MVALNASGGIFFGIFGIAGEPLAKLDKTTTPVTSGVQKILKNLDSGPRTRHFRCRLRRNDVEGLLQEAQDYWNFSVEKTSDGELLTVNQELSI